MTELNTFEFSNSHVQPSQATSHRHWCGGELAIGQCCQWFLIVPTIRIAVVPKELGPRTVGKRVYECRYLDYFRPAKVLHHRQGWLITLRMLVKHCPPLPCWVLCPQLSGLQPEWRPKLDCSAALQTPRVHQGSAGVPELDSSTSSSSIGPAKRQNAANSSKVRFPSIDSSTFS